MTKNNNNCIINMTKAIHKIDVSGEITLKFKALSKSSLIYDQRFRDQRRSEKQTFIWTAKAIVSVTRDWLIIEG